MVRRQTKSGWRSISQERGQAPILKGIQAMPCWICLKSPSWRSEHLQSQMHHVDLRYTKEELDLGGHDPCHGGAIHLWSHPWHHAAVRYDSSPLGALYVSWLEERIDRIETEEGVDLAALLHALAMLERKAFGDIKHGVERFSEGQSHGTRDQLAPGQGQQTDERLEGCLCRDADAPIRPRG